MRRPRYKGYYNTWYLKSQSRLPDAVTLAIVVTGMSTFWPNRETFKVRRERESLRKNMKRKKVVGVSRRYGI